MKLELETNDNSIFPTVFKINEVQAEYDDFGTIRSKNYKNCKNEVGVMCVYHDFRPQIPQKEILEKYDIDVGDYMFISEYIKNKLSKPCNWC
jgi:hypothetical protein